ncbi:MAG: mechanosensitive ion channel family protein [Firmicutes bacterium]|nr:mechanosensitive ion channel family protein [Bacillota bacterium]
MAVNIALVTLSQLLEDFNFTDAAGRIVQWVKTNGPEVIFILAISAIAYKLLSITIDRAIALISKDTFLTAEQAKQRAKTLGSVLKALARFVIAFIAILMIIDRFTNIGPLLAGAGIAGVAIGFGAQSLVRDFISGFFILFENQYGVGDVVQIGSSKGTVEDLDLRTTRLRDIQGRLHIIPNGEVKLVINQSRGWARAIVDIGVSNQVDPNKVKQIMQEEMDILAGAAEWKEILFEPPQVSGIEEFRENAMIIRVSAVTKPGHQDSLAEQIRTSIKTRLARENIEVIGKP